MNHPNTVRFGAIILGAELTDGPPAPGTPHAELRALLESGASDDDVQARLRGLLPVEDA